MTHLGTKTLETPRLIIRAFKPEDGHDMFVNWASDPQVTRFLTWPPYKNEEDAVTFCTARSVLADTPQIYDWVIELRENRQAVGSIGAMNFRDKQATCELGYCLSASYWGRGLMTEAVKAVIAYLIDEVGLWRIAAYHDVANPASGRVMQKAGMQLEGILRGYNLRGDGTRCDCALYSVIKTDVR